MNLYDQLNTNNSVIRNIEAKQDECMSNIQVVQRSTAQTTHTIDQLGGNVRRQEEGIKVLSYMSIDTEARSRRNTILFYNITDISRHSSDKTLILNFMVNELDIVRILGSLRQDTFRGRSDPR